MQCPPLPAYVIIRDSGKTDSKSLEEIQSAAERDAAAEQIIRKAGGRLLAHYYTFGRYDFVVVADLPSTEALARIYLGISRWGTVTTETMTALLPEQVYRVAMEARDKGS